MSAFYPGSRRPRPLAVDECASVWPGCRPTGASSMVPRALPVGLHNAVQPFLFMAKLALPPHQERLNNLEEVYSNESSGPLQFLFLTNGGHAIGLEGFQST
jgi:hypothetical protein